MGKSLGNCIIKIPNVQKENFIQAAKPVISEYLKNLPTEMEDNNNYFISEPIQNYSWVPVFPAPETSGSQKLAKYLSEKYATVTIYLSIYDSEDIFFQIYNNGEDVLLYKYTPATENYKEPKWKGDLQNVLKLFGVDESKTQEFNDILQGQKIEDEYGVFYKVYADNQFSKIIDFLGLSGLYIMQDYGYRYLKDSSTLNRLLDSGQLTKTEHVKV